MTKQFIYVFVCALGLLGLYFKVEYAGFVLFVGLMGLL
jgi:hypothetical protein